MMRYRVTVLERTVAAGSFGRNSGNVSFEETGTVWAAVDFQRGVKAVREAAVDGTDYILVRMRWNELVTRDSYLRIDGVTYMVTEFHRDFQDNILQLKAQEIITDRNHVSRSDL